MSIALAIAINVTLVILVLTMSTRRDFAGEPIGPGGWVLLTVLFGPVGFIAFLIVSRRARRHPGHGSKRCPACAEDVRSEASVCRFCGHTLV